MGRSTVHYTDSNTNNILKRLHNKLRPAGTPVERVEYIIELLLLRIFEVKLKHEEEFKPLRKMFDDENYIYLFSYLSSLTGEQILAHLNKSVFPFYSSILIKSKDFIKGNLPTKIQDQLVLMVEVFENSNFTNNVKGGVMSEVIGLINEIEENLILKTDLLGDAIESALSETGGTKDIGLYRTPQHIRKFMVSMVDPDFSDIIFDPACGTAGFLFDSFEYIMEKAKSLRKFPTTGVANQFYRNGLSGIEYSGRIRKMAAVNLYVRGLNPHNIQQGDSLKMYDPSTDANSKSIVIANPPFGAERDQPAYPNVWEDYSKESETTILFVKLMLDTLKPGGRCAVIVSEGFLTWGQGSACALRKILLQDTNLKAIISLPQGVFVSKSGQGAKTSILYFEKGQPTDFIWYYKIENDGFSMGTNRKPIEGDQIPELLELFKEVKQNKKPDDTKYSFCISREQIETLDPRIADKIKIDVREKNTEKIAYKREKLIVYLDDKLKKNKIDKEIYNDKLNQFDLVSESQIENEITKAIEKAHSYHFNLSNYRSILTYEQIKDWQETLKGVEIKDDSNIEKCYKELQNADTKLALQIFSSFNPQDALQMDIAREYLSNLDKRDLYKDEKLKQFEEILRKGFKFPNIELGELLIPKYEKIKKDDFQGDFDVVEKISFGEGKIHIRERRETGMDLYKAEVGDLITSKINVHQGAMALSPSELVCSTHYQVYSINKAEVSKYLLLVLRSEKFLEIVNIEKAGGIKNESGAEFLAKFKIPFPPLEVQNEIVEKIEKQMQIIEGAKRIEENWIIHIDIPENTEKVFLKDITSYITDGTHKTPNYVQIGIPFISAQNIVDFRIDFENVKYISNEEYEQYFKNKNLQKDDVLLAKSGTIGISALFESSEKFAFYESLALIRPKMEKVIPKYLVNFLNSSYSNILTKQNQKGVGVQHLHLEDVRNFEILLPPLKIQQQIVEKLDKQMQALKCVRLLKSEAEKRINEILSEVWGEEKEIKE